MIAERAGATAQTPRHPDERRNYNSILSNRRRSSARHRDQVMPFD
jgi:hypothetical protein